MASLDFKTLHVEALSELDAAGGFGSGSSDDPCAPSPRPPPVTPRAYLKAILSRTSERLSEAGFERTPRRAPPGGFGRVRGSAGTPRAAAPEAADAEAAPAAAPASAPPATAPHGEMRRCVTSAREQEAQEAPAQAAAAGAAPAAGALPEVAAAATAPGGGPAAAPGRARRHST
jgi:hypothetical protein